MLSQLPDRWQRRIQIEGDHWIWTGAKSRRHYGVTRVAGRQQRAHRAIWEFLYGAVAPDEELDHLCRVTLCVNPAHLEPVTHAENVRRGLGWGGVNCRKTHCPKGHPYDMEESGRRRCRTCRREVIKEATQKYREQLRVNT